MYIIQSVKSERILARADTAVYAIMSACDAHYASGEAIIVLRHKQGTTEEIARIDPINDRSSRYHRKGKKPRLIPATGERLL